MKIDVDELSCRLDEMLDRASAGERVLITRHGRAIAVLGPAMPIPSRQFRMQNGWTTERAIAEDRGD